MIVNVIPLYERAFHAFELDMADTPLSHCANVRRISLQLGIIEPADLVAWADDEIEAADVPASPLIDLSFSRTKPVA